MIEVVAGLGSGGQEPGGGQGAEETGKAQTAFHPEPERVEFEVVADDEFAGEQFAQRPEAAAEGLQIEDED